MRKPRAWRRRRREAPHRIGRRRLVIVSDDRRLVVEVTEVQPGAAILLHVEIIGFLAERSADRNVLIVEDNRQNLELVQFLLEEAGLRVRSAGDARQAREELEREVPDLILMDIALGDMDGWEATRQIKHNPRTATIPVIAAIDSSSRSCASNTGGLSSCMSLE